AMTRCAPLRAGLAALLAGFVCTGLSPARPGASTRPVLSERPGAAEDWSAFAADVIIRRSRVDAAGRPLGSFAPAVTYRWEQTRTPRGVRTVFALVASERRMVRTLHGEEPLDSPFAIARVEEEGDGSPLRLFDERGRAVEVPDADASRLAALMRADGLVPAVPPSRAPAGADPPVRPAGAFPWPVPVERVTDAPARRAALERRFGRPSGRVGAHDRYELRTGDALVEVLADPNSALPVEINVAREGQLKSQIRMRYAPTEGGALVRQAVRAERLLEDGRGTRTVTDIELANVRLEPRRGR
ncbi:MAG TPA: hypothetical protein VNI83_02760, partial [Vicinamibacterales bacterium]|nr:hypothetical protein [Vicinamibacterales bacterium]